MCKQITLNTHWKSSQLTNQEINAAAFDPANQASPTSSVSPPIPNLNFDKVRKGIQKLSLSFPITPPSHFIPSTALIQLLICQRDLISEGFEGMLRSRVGHVDHRGMNSCNHERLPGQCPPVATEGDRVRITNYGPLVLESSIVLEEKLYKLTSCEICFLIRGYTLENMT